MTVTLTPELERIIADQIATGQFASTEEVIESGLKILQQQYEELKAMIAESEEDVRNGRVAPFDPMATLARVQARHLAKAGEVERIAV